MMHQPQTEKKIERGYGVRSKINNKKEKVEDETSGKKTKL